MVEFNGTGFVDQIKDWNTCDFDLKKHSGLDNAVRALGNFCVGFARATACLITLSGSEWAVLGIRSATAAKVGKIAEGHFGSSSTDSIDSTDPSSTKPEPDNTQSSAPPPPPGDLQTNIPFGTAAPKASNTSSKIEEILVYPKVTESDFQENKVLVVKDKLQLHGYHDFYENGTEFIVKMDSENKLILVQQNNKSKPKGPLTEGEKKLAGTQEAMSEKLPEELNLSDVEDLLVNFRVKGDEPRKIAKPKMAYVNDAKELKESDFVGDQVVSVNQVLLLTEDLVLSKERTLEKGSMVTVESSTDEKVAVTWKDEEGKDLSDEIDRNSLKSFKFMLAREELSLEREGDGTLYSLGPIADLNQIAEELKQKPREPKWVILRDDFKCSGNVHKTFLKGSYLEVNSVSSKDGIVEIKWKDGEEIRYEKIRSTSLNDTTEPQAEAGFVGESEIKSGQWLVLNEEFKGHYKLKPEGKGLPKGYLFKPEKVVLGAPKKITSVPEAENMDPISNGDVLTSSYVLLRQAVSQKQGHTTVNGKVGELFKISAVNPNKQKVTLQYGSKTFPNIPVSQLAKPTLEQMEALGVAPKGQKNKKKVEPKEDPSGDPVILVDKVEISIPRKLLSFPTSQQIEEKIENQVSETTKNVLGDDPIERKLQVGEKVKLFRGVGLLKKEDAFEVIEPFNNYSGEDVKLRSLKKNSLGKHEEISVDKSFLNHIAEEDMPVQETAVKMPADERQTSEKTETAKSKKEAIPVFGRVSSERLIKDKNEIKIGDYLIIREELSVQRVIGKDTFNPGEYLKILEISEDGKTVKLKKKGKLPLEDVSLDKLRMPEEEEVEQILKAEKPEESRKEEPKKPSNIENLFKGIPVIQQPVGEISYKEIVGQKWVLNVDTDEIPKDTEVTVTEYNEDDDTYSVEAEGGDYTDVKYEDLKELIVDDKGDPPTFEQIIDAPKVSSNQLRMLNEHTVYVILNELIENEEDIELGDYFQVVKFNKENQSVDLEIGAIELSNVPLSKLRMPSDNESEKILEYEKD